MKARRTADKMDKKLVFAAWDPCPPIEGHKRFRGTSSGLQADARIMRSSKKKTVVTVGMSACFGKTCGGSGLRACRSHLDKICIET